MADMSKCTAACYPFHDSHDPNRYHQCLLDPGHGGNHRFDCNEAHVCRCGHGAEVATLTAQRDGWRHVAEYYLGEFSDAHDHIQCRAEQRVTTSHGGSRPGAGRKPTGDGSKASLNIRVDEARLAAYREAAARCEMTLTAWVIERLDVGTQWTWRR